MSNRRIESPDLNSDIELAPSGTKRAKVSNVGGIIIGSNTDDADNVKLHRAASDKIEIVIGSDTSAEGTSAPPANLARLGMKGITVSEISASEAVVGTSGTTSENIKLRRGGAGDLEIVTADESTAEGTETFTKRTDVKMKSNTIGASSTSSENVKLHRAGASKLEFVAGDDTTADGLETTSLKSGIIAKSIDIGAPSNDDGGTIYRSGPQELEVIAEYQNPTDGSRFPEARIQINFASSIMGEDSTEANNIRVRKGQANELELAKGNDTSTINARSPSKAQLNVDGLMLGSDSTLANNAKIHRGASKELEIVDGSSYGSEVDGTRSSAKAQLNAKAVSVGNEGDATHGDNVKLHRGNTHEMEVVEADDSTVDGTRSANKAQLNSKDILIGSDAATLANNVKLHRSGSAEVEFLSGSDNATTSDGTAYPASRAKVNLESLVVGKSTTVSENSKLHRYLNTAYATDETELEVVDGADVTVDGMMSSTGRRNANVKGLTVGQSAAASENAKLHRGGTGILEVVSGDDVTAEGTPSVNKTQLSAKTLHVGTSATDSQNVKFHRGASNVVQAVMGDDTNPEGTLSTTLNQMSFKFETYADGSQPVATGQDSRCIWNSTLKQIEISNGTVTWDVLGENKHRHIIENVGFTATPSAGTMVVALKDALGSDPSYELPVKAAFRDSIASSDWSLERVNSALSLTISSGATLGTSSALEGRIYIYLIYTSANGVELAVSQKHFDGSSLVNTTAISGTADSVDGFYSTTARTSASVANIGYFESTQATAGTWATSPTKLQSGDMGPKDEKLMSSSVAGPGDIAVCSPVTQTIPNSSGKVAVTNLDVDLSTTGRPVRLQLQPGPSGGVGTTGYIKVGQNNTSGSVSGKVFIYRGSTEIAAFELEKKVTSPVGGDALTVSPSCIDFIDNASSGVYNYSISAQSPSANGILDIVNVKLVAYEL